MKKTLITLTVAALLVTLAVPAGAKKPPAGPPSPTNPPECTISEAFFDDVAFTVTGSRVRESKFYDVITEVLLEGRVASDLCVEVKVIKGSLSDLNVALVDYPDGAARRCGGYWPGGKINAGYTFDVGFSLADRNGIAAGEAGYCGSDPGIDTNGGGLTVEVQPLTSAKTTSADLSVRMGFVDLP